MVRRVRVNAIAIAELMLGLQDGCHTMLELADLSGLSIKTVRNYLKQLHGRKLTHICDWREDAKGARTLKVYELGRGVDMPKPEPRPKAETCKRYREKIKQAKLLQRMAANFNQFEEAA